jgi:hypothetical protein
VAVNGESTFGKKHMEVVQCLKSLPKGETVTLRMATHTNEMQKQNGDIFVLPEDLFIRRIILPHIMYSQRIQLFRIQKMCDRFHFENHF